MASATDLLDPQQFICSICLDVFAEPVTISCGHNFCKACVTKYWDECEQYNCPMCKKSFEKRPDVCVNTLMSEMVAAHFKMAVHVKAAGSNHHNQEEGAVLCDFCPGTKLKALKSCLVCSASFCETHLEPHQRVAALKRHKLINPVENLEDRICKKHDKLLDLYCRTEQLCVCVMCTEHKGHETVPVEEEYERRKVQLGKRIPEYQEMIEERRRKVEEIERSVEEGKTVAEKEIAEWAEAVAALMASVRTKQDELISAIEEKQKAAEKQAEECITELEQEITELQRRSSEMEHLSHAEDHLQLLQRLPSVFSSPHAKDLSDIPVRTHLHRPRLGLAVAQLEKTIAQEVQRILVQEDLENLAIDVRLRLMQQLYTVDVTLDPDTAQPQLIVSGDGKQVTRGDKYQQLPDNPKRFDYYSFVLGREGFTSGRFYYEVEVEGKDWCLGVFKESVNRKEGLYVNTKDGYWFICGNKRTFSGVKLSWKQNMSKVGVFVDYEEGLVSFYHVEAKVHIYSFTGCTFTEKIYPAFYPNVSLRITALR